MSKVSIIIPLHNKEPYVAETINSVLAQTMSDWEMIVVENASTDRGPNVVRAFSDPRIRLINSLKKGPGGARNYGLRLAEGEWVLFLDADDLIESNYLECRLSDARKCPESDIVAGPWQEFDSREPSVRTLRYPAVWKGCMKKLDAAAFAYAPWVIHAAIIRREILTPDRLWNENLDHLPSEDCAFWYPVIHRNRVVWSDNAGAHYRRNISFSRDDNVKNSEVGFSACMGTLEANRRFLQNRGRSPSSEQVATVVRVLEKLLSKETDIDSPQYFRTLKEIHRWVGSTSLTDIGMLYRRLKYRVFCLKKLQRFDEKIII